MILGPDCGVGAASRSPASNVTWPVSINSRISAGGSGRSVSLIGVGFSATAKQALHNNHKSSAVKHCPQDRDLAGIDLYTAFDHLVTMICLG